MTTSAGVPLEDNVGSLVDGEAVVLVMDRAAPICETKHPYKAGILVH